MRVFKLSASNLVLIAAVLTLAIGWRIEHRRFLVVSAALSEFQMETEAAEAASDQQPERQHVPLAGVPKGAVSAPITIVEFVDFQCPFCGRATETIDQVFKEYLGQVRFYICHSPLPFHPDAALAAEAALAADEQGKIWQMHDKIMASQQSLAREDLETYAREIALDMGKFTQSLDARAHRTRIDRDIALAEKLGARGTPTFFINGRKLSGAQPFEAFKAVIDDELGRARQLMAKGTPAEKVYEVLTASAAPDVSRHLRR